MAHSRRLIPGLLLMLGVLLAAGPTYAQWDQASFDIITSGPDNNLLDRRSLAIDDSRTLHAVYSTVIGSHKDLYYISKPAGGVWSAPEMIGDPAADRGGPWVTVRKDTGEPYVAFFEDLEFVLGIRRTGGWEYHTITLPEGLGPAKISMTVDALGYAHIALLVRREEPLIWQMGYGYWDGSPDFHFQLFEWSDAPEFGLFAQPDIVVRPDGSVVTAFQTNVYGQFVIAVAENGSLGGTAWRLSKVDVANGIVYPESLAITPRGELHLAFHFDVELGAEKRVFHTFKRAHSRTWETPEEVSGPFRGARPKMALTKKGDVQIVFEETRGPKATGRLVHVIQDHGKWRQAYVVEGAAFDPTFVLDPDGAGSILFRREITPLYDSDVEYYGYVTPPR